MRRSAGPKHPMGIAVLGASLVALTTFGILSQGFQPEQPEISVPAPEPVVVKANPKIRRAAFFDAEVEPQIIETDHLNRQAAERCIFRLRSVLRGYRDGVRPFVEDLTSISTRLGIVRRMPGNWWHEDKRIEIYVQQKFEQHLFSEKDLLGDVSKVLEDFRDEVEANQKRMLVNVQASLDTADLPDVTIDQYKPFFDAIAKRLRGYSAD
ncbi:MAG: hypothetical protein MI861_14385, partial [Pirellulales bacterium]|nr:hypothetical protein [Pirellulales bacterium]